MTLTKYENVKKEKLMLYIATKCLYIKEKYHIIHHFS
jgi:hypothetical protein